MKIKQQSNKKSTSDRIFLTGIFIMILSTQGILINFILSNIGIGFIKSIIFEIGVVLLILATIYKAIFEEKMKYKLLNLFIVTYIILEISLLLFKQISFIDILYVIKETWIAILLIIIIKNFSYTLINNNKNIIKLLLLLNILNLLATIISHVIGSEKYMTILTGRYIYPLDTELNFKVSHINGILRTPALIGESASFSYFSAISFIIFNIFKCKLGKMVSLLNVILAFTRSGYIFILIYILFNLVKTISIKRKISIYRFTTYNILAIIIFTSSYLFIIKNKDFISNLFSTSSTIERFEFWNEITENNINENILEVLIGGGIGEIGNVSRANGFLRIFDNTWLYLYYSIGIIGLILFIFFFFKESKYNYQKLSIIISLFVAMIFVNVFQSEVIIGMIPILLVLSDYKNKQDMKG